MNLTTLWTEVQVYALEQYIDYIVFYIAMAYFAIELFVYWLKKRMSMDLIGDSLTNFVTLGVTLAVNYALAAIFYVAAFYWIYENISLSHLPINLWTIFACVVLADVAYYWEHRFLHSVGIGWATHTVHHSSPHFNLSVAYRHGPLDGLFPFLFHAPLVMLGFNPIVVFFCEVMVQLFQTLLHTETIRKFPRPIEAVFNTPSHHRVHHATNRQYLDKNYAGIFIIWDRMFGTFAEEKEPVRYGVFPRINTNNPFTVYFKGFQVLGSRLWNAPNWKYRLNLLVKSPTWAWQQEQVSKRNVA
ncbi:Uncharacterised protein [BD1-7 clade bacterium]|uniref:Fatty acid hydroxylase domain-containing protein n=1 Tax=BD1-7 clade bacterium TaxID=2029982 RepID=A0A5S9PLY7_9GAMM|nr:Uncharacterised protein [BD1-7 clade bacterium]